MATRRITTSIELDGEQEFKRQMSSVNSELKTLKSDMALATAEFQGQANSMEALTAKDKLLRQEIEQQQEKVKALEKAVSDANEAFKESPEKVDKYKQQLNRAKIDLIKMNSELEENTRYLDEAKNSADGCAESIDGFGKEVSQAADEAESAGDSFGQQMSLVDSKLKTLKSDMALATAEFHGQANSMEALAEKNRLLQSEVDQQKIKVEALEGALRDAAEAYGENDRRVDAYKQQLNNAKIDLLKMNGELQDNERYLDEARNSADGCARSIDGFGKEVSQAADKADDAGDSFGGLGSSMRDAFTIGAVSGAVQSMVGSLQGLIDETEEYRKIMASLEVSSDLAGYSAEETKETYRQLFGVLGDDQTAATTTANLQALGLAQDQLKELTDGVIGAWAKYGDSIPIDGLSEAINETIKVGQVTGTFADVLNWAGTSEDDFNAKLEACGSQSERVNLVLQALSDQGLAGAAQSWRDNNQAMVEANQATADGMDTMARFAEMVQPAFTAVKEAINGATGSILDMVESGDPAIYILEGLAVAALALGVALNMGAIITGVTDAMTKMKAATLALNAAMAANPIGVVLALLAGLAAAFVTAYQTNDEFRARVDAAFSNVKEIISGAVDLVTGFFTEDIPAAIDKGMEWFEKLPEEMREVGANLLMGLWNGIGDKVDWLKGKVFGVVDTIKGWFTGPEGFDEHSPSKWSAQVFRYLLEGGGQGLDEGAPGLYRNVESVTGRVKDLFGQPIPSNYEVAASLNTNLNVPERGVSNGQFQRGLEQAVNALQVGNAESFGRYVIELIWQVDGKTLYRETIDDLRSVMKSSPEVVSDT